MKKIIREAGEHLTHKYEIFLLGLDFIISKFLLLNGLEINFEIS